MKRVLRTVVLGACVASAVAFGGIYPDRGGDATHTTRAQQGPDLGEVFRATIRGGSTQNNECDVRSAGLGSATGESGGGSGSGAPMPFQGSTGSDHQCRNTRG
ncbi:hypothetical protein [Streptomyces sp. Rer75]|uniref:hypothetical protein n=1 Tax=unclassified Streptomyces TaxID=2593676 RepID=UPI0015CFB880|nr:hypothetical protein [Streptomyces sp. Rer75]QLH21520.1 hypothetical protein HYQ63_13540 [Streptomyces sp. Rer75]